MFQLVEKKSRFLLQRKGVVSSAKLQTLQSSRKIETFKYMLKDNRPRTDSCGTPWSILEKDSLWRKILTLVKES